MSKMDDIVEAEPDYSDFCDVEVMCYEARGIAWWKTDREGNMIQTYVCGFIPVGTVPHCPRRRRLRGEVQDG